MNTIMINGANLRFSQSSAKQWFYLVLLTCTAGSVGCSTYGTVTVSDPQVFTRERLIQERFDEYQWMGRQLDKIPTESRFQGLRDFREFTGIHNKLAIQFDPLQGAVDALSQRGKILDNETAYLKKRLDKEKAERALREYIADSSNSTQETGYKEPQENDQAKTSNQPTSASVNKSNDAEKESPDPIAGKNETNLKLAQIRKDLEPLPKVSDAEKVDKEVQPGIADLFHDQLAYRNIVRAAMREKQLDDSHDLFGSMLYDLQFDITLQPGDYSDRYAKIMLELKEPPCIDKQQSEMKQSLKPSNSPHYRKQAIPGICDNLYHNYVEQLERQVAARIVTLQQAYRRGELSRHDKKWLDQSIKFLLPKATTKLAIEAAGARSEITQAASQIKSDLDYNSSDRNSSAKEEEDDIKYLKGLSIDALKNTPTVKNLRAHTESREAANCDNLMGIEKALCRVPEDSKRSLNTELEKAPAKEKKAKDVGGEIDKIVRYFNGRNIDAVLNPGFVHIHGNAVKMAIVWAVWNQYNALDEFVTVLPPRTTDDNRVPLNDPDGPFIFGIREDGDKKGTFERHLRNSMRIVAFSIEPKEYAQNISDVAAQERLVSLVMQLKATLPQYGITADNYSEYVNRTQEFVQAINRRPLAIGYGGGSKSFGWILGPKFAIAQPPSLLSRVKNLFAGHSLVEFSHVPVRHTFRASVVVPAWWDHIDIEARSRWIDFNGDDVDAHSRWIRVDRDSSSTQPIKAALPKPSESWLAITEALLRSDQDSQPKPRVSYPDPTKTDRKLLELREYDPNAEETHHQTLLIEGEDLWRSPEVYVGAVKASHVHITPDMKGLYAVFDFRKNATEPIKSTLFPKLIDKGSKSLDLTVVTSGGRDVVPNGVTYLAKTRLTEIVSPSVTLNQTFVIGKEGPIKFAVNNLGGYHGLTLNLRPANKANTESWRSAADLKWNEDRSMITTNFSNIRNAQNNPATLQTQELEIRMLVKKFADAREEDVLGKDNRTIVYFSNETDSQFKLVSSNLVFTNTEAGNNEIRNKIKNDLTIEVPLADKALFYKAYPGLKVAAEKRDGSLKIVFKGGDNTTNMRPLYFDAIYAPGGNDNHRDQFHISKDALNKYINELTILDGGKYKVTVEFGHTTIQTDRLLILKKDQ